MNDPRFRTPMTTRPDTGTPKQREGCWPIMLRRLPGPLNMEAWRQRVDEYLREKAELDRQRAQEPQTSAGERRDR